VNHPSIEIFQSILLNQLQPWRNENLLMTDAKYKQLIQSIQREYYSFQPLYSIDFPKPLTPKRKYYFLLIENAAIGYLNKIQNEIKSALNTEEKQYWIHATLAKTLSQNLIDTENIIAARKCSLANMSSTELAIQDESYIIQYLKHQLVRLFLEIQETNKDLVKEDLLTIKELNAKFFSDPINEEYFKPADIVKGVEKIATSIKSEIVFEPKAYDFRKPAKGILSYDEVVRNKNRFYDFEATLFHQGLIDINYNFTDKHGKIQELAAAFHALIQKNFFNTMKFPGAKAIKPLDIRKFLDHRYGSNTEKQFRVWANKQEELSSYIDARWMYRIPPC